MSKRVIILGAGCSGRGQLGQLAHEAGWELVLVDRDEALVERLRQAGCYTVRLCRADGAREVRVAGFRAYGVSETEAVVREALEAPLILTCLFSHNLPAVAPLVAQIIEARHAAGSTQPLNVVCCENMQHGSTVFRTQVLPLLTGAAAAYAEQFVGFPDCMISRVVPLATEDPLALLAEDYSEWTVDQAQFKGPPLDLPALERVPNQEARLARKFFMHNGAHAVCAYWGFHRGHTYIHEAIADPVVLGHVLGAIDELAFVVARHYGFEVAATRAYGLELGPRGAIAAIRDRILRVVRDPLRKLSREERFVAPAVLALADGSPGAELAAAIAAALHYQHPDDPQSVAMQQRLRDEGLARALPAIMGVPAEHPLVAAVTRCYQQWRP
jgi:mannitol-1-phosphate 5-dehydrogenase